MARCSKEGILKFFQWTLSVAIVVLCFVSSFWNVDEAGAMWAVAAMAIFCCLTLTIIGVIYLCGLYNKGCLIQWPWKRIECVHAVVCTMVYIASMVISAVMARKFANVSPLSRYLISCAVLSGFAMALCFIYLFLTWRGYEPTIARRTQEKMKMDKWEDMGGQIWKRVELPTYSHEYKRVLALFKKTLRNIKVQKIERIQNPTRHKQFKVQKEMVTDVIAGRRQVITRELFHGTDAGNCDSICNQNFDRGHSGINGTMYGKGVYFATTAQYSDAYASGNPKHMFLAEVITGEYCEGNSSMTVAPMQPNGSPYDSVVDNMTNPTMFVVFKDASVYPAYLVTYSEKHSRR